MTTETDLDAGWTVRSSSPAPAPEAAPPAPGGGWPRSAVVTTGALAAVLALGGVFAAGLAVGGDDDAPASAQAATGPADDVGDEAAPGTDGDVTTGAGAVSDAVTDEADDADAGEDATVTGADDGEPSATAAEDEEAEAANAETSSADEAEDDVADDPADAGSEDEGPRVQGPDELPVRRAVLLGGQVYLQGRVPSQAVADEIAGKVAQVVGPDNVVVEYEVDPAAPLPASAPLFIADQVLFSSGSSRIRPAFTPIMDLGVSLLTRFPDATLSIIGHTDPIGSEASNLALSQRRVDAVVDYMTRRGVAADQLVGEARGEAEALTGDTADAAALAASRRTEFVVNGLLDR